MGCWIKSRTRRISVALLFTVLSMIAMANPGLADETGTLAFSHEIYTFDADTAGMASLRVVTQVSYDELQFVKDERGGYRTEYEITVVLRDRQGFQVDGKTMTRTHTVKDFNLTNLNTVVDIVEMDFDVPPDTYDVNIKMQDLETKDFSHREIQVNASDYSCDALGVSDLVYMNLIVDDSTRTMRYRTNVLSDLNGSQRSFSLLFEVYDRSGLDSVKVRYHILNHKKKKLFKKDFYALLKGYRTTVQIEIPKEEFGAGRYELVLEVGEGRDRIKRSKAFSVHWTGMPRYAWDLDKAVEQLTYLVKGKTLKGMKRAEGIEKERLFREFWKALDPDPETGVNEFMEAYYRRVAYADEHFTSRREGWRTDRGMVYITLGPPENIERRPFNLDSRPYEIWYYYRVNRSLMFVDERGFGDYRLQSLSTFREIVREMQ